MTRTRHVPEALKIAVEEKHPTCNVRGCDRTDHLERHHTLEFAEHQLTAYEILVRLCPDHHDLVTHRGYALEPQPDGTAILLPSDHGEQRDTDAA